MARRWNSIKSVDNDIHMICTILAENGSLPENLVYSFQAMMDSASAAKPGLVLHFYDGLTKECPKALEYFK